MQKEKLIELLDMNCGYTAEMKADDLADYLIDNGVTVQEWISVNDKLPELIPCNDGTACSEAVVVLTTDRVVLVVVWDGVDWIGAFDYWGVMGEEITHWMPLPELPKEGER